MSSPHIQSVSVATEATFGSIGATGAPDASGLPYVSGPVLRAPAFAAVGEPELTERPDARDGPHIYPPDYATTRDNATGLLRPRRPAVVSVTLPLETIGAGGGAITGFDLSMLGRILSSAMSAPALPGASTDPNPAAVGANQFTPSIPAADFLAGGLFGVATADHTMEYSGVVNSAGANVEHSPALSVGVAAPLTVQLLRTWSVDNRFAVGAASSLAFRLDGHGWRYYAVGGRLQALSIASNGRRLDATCTIQFADSYQAHADAAVVGGTNIVEPTRMDGGPAFSLGARTVVSSATVNAVTAPAALGSTEILLDEWSVNCTWTLGPQRSSNAIGSTDLEVTDFDVEVTAFASVAPAAAPAHLDNGLMDGDQYSLILAASGGGAGRGSCVYLPAATFRSTDPALRDASGDIIRYPLTFGAGRWAGDVGTSSPANTVFRLGLAGP